VADAERRTLTTVDGYQLEAEYVRPDGLIRCGAVLCHPHPQFGGNMRSIVTSALFAALPTAGIACLRFNFRGVEGSEGTYTGGFREMDDVMAAIAALDELLGPAVPRMLAGWSFGGDVALSVHDRRVAGWFAVAPPLRFASRTGPVAADDRPKLIVLGEHDEVQEADEVEATVSSWNATRVEVVGGASHFFVGRTDRVVELAREFARSLGR
jgi:alpha/beta superfamily hydrolase